MNQDPLLTNEERKAVELIGQVACLLSDIIGTGPTSQQDADEIIIHIHAIQRSILAQAAGRAYPDDYRLLGETVVRKE